MICVRRQSIVVSIHARFISRAIPAHGPQNFISDRFNPRPVYKPGDTFEVGHRVNPISRFNPRPVYKPGDTVTLPLVLRDANVSIHARFISRAIRYGRLGRVGR